MINLKLRTFEEPATEPENLRFPSELVRSFGRQDGSPEGTDADPIDMARHIERTLDAMQRDLDRVQDELERFERGFQFPREDDWRPFAA
ncbi:MAG: hypothetical protein VYC34_00240 [Planctomycetota bacterium]|nr:hypothetical protein [Planctomycetota bacterium]